MRRTIRKKKICAYLSSPVICRLRKPRRRSTNVSVTFSSVKLKPVRKRYGECEGRRASSDRSDKIGENKKGDRVRQKRRVKFIHKKENYYERRRSATPAKWMIPPATLTSLPPPFPDLPPAPERRLPPPFCPAPSLQPWKISRDKPRFSPSSHKSFRSLSLFLPLSFFLLLRSLPLSLPLELLARW